MHGDWGCRGNSLVCSDLFLGNCCYWRDVELCCYTRLRWQSRMHCVVNCMVAVFHGVRSMSSARELIFSVCLRDRIMNHLIMNACPLGWQVAAMSLTHRAVSCMGAAHT